VAKYLFLTIGAFFAVTGCVGCKKSSAKPASVSVSGATLATLPIAAATAPPTAPVVAQDAVSRHACGEAMVLVSGDYCPDVEQRCLEWLDPPGSRYEHFRCARYAKPAVCKSAKRRPLHFCIERAEHVEPGSDIPMNHTSWTDATRICAASGARLCTASEWQFACEGEEMRPYPYGWERDSAACNVDVMNGLGYVGRLVDHRTPASAHPRCLSAFGVHDMAGNVDERGLGARATRSHERFVVDPRSTRVPLLSRRTRRKLRRHRNRRSLL